MFTDEKPIKQVINELLNAYKLNGKIDELKIWNNWPDIVGVVIAKNTSKLQLKGNTLYIYVESAPLKVNLRFTAVLFCKKLMPILELKSLKKYISNNVL